VPDIVEFLASRGGINMWLRDDAAEALEKAYQGGADADQVIAAAEHLVELGSSVAGALIATIKEGNGGG
jgi:hypothetical protein